MIDYSRPMRHLRLLQGGAEADAMTDEERTRALARIRAMTRDPKRSAIVAGTFRAMMR